MAKHEIENEEKIKKPKIRIVLSIFLIIALACSAFAIYEIFLLSSIETLLRYIVMGILILIDVVLFIKVRIASKKRKKKRNKRIGLISFMLIYSLICFAVGLVIAYFYGQLSSINKAYVTYTSDLVVMKDNEAKKVDDIKDYTIGILKDKDSPDGYIIPREMIKENKLEDDNEIKKYDDYSTMLVDLYAGDVDAIFITDNYVDMFASVSGYEDVGTDTKIILSKDKKMKKSDTSEQEVSSAGKSITEPFTMLLMGIDSTDEVLEKNAIANGDTLILITFNPKTLNATMISIPRDSYVPIACWSDKTENKITHAAGYGTDCMMQTIEDYFGINIDYYAKINFKGLVKLVNAVGGVEVNVDANQTLCTDDSSRGGQVCIDPGLQTLNGEQALVYARNRKQLVNGDFGRGQHQQEIILALMDKMKTITSVSTFMDIMNTVSNSLDTNLTTKQILSFYNLGKDIVKRSASKEASNLVNIQQLYLQGQGQMIYDERMRMVLYNYVPNEQSKKDVVRAMKENLGLVEHKVIKKFSFSINEPYEKEVIGYGPYKSSGGYTLLPDFTGDSEAQARATASRLGISVNFVGGNGYVIAQEYPEGKRIDKIRGSVTLTLGGSKKEVIEDNDTEEKTPSNDTKEEEEDKTPICGDNEVLEGNQCVSKEPEEPTPSEEPEQPTE
ncbi:MAG: LCP family protein [Candidatus Faecimonas sp.]|nr:LCP family protein [Candidatus Faecimonas sp.]